MMSSSAPKAKPTRNAPARAYAVVGDKAAALSALRRSVEWGFICYPYIAFDPLLSTLREENDFSSILELARQRHKAFKRAFS